MRPGGRRRGSGASTMLGAALEIPGDNGFVDRGRILSAGDAAAEEGAGSPDRGSGGEDPATLEIGGRRRRPDQSGGDFFNEIQGKSSTASSLGGCRRLSSVFRGGVVFDLQRSAAEAHPQSTVDEDEGVGWRLTSS